MTRALIVLNPAAHGGRARERYARIESLVASRLTPELIETDPGAKWQDAVGQAFDGGTRLFVAAGGDGTVSALVDTLARRRGNVPLPEITLGAIGLGSSNDFHKPYRKVVAGVPLRIDAAGTVCTRRDVGLARFVSAAGVGGSRHFVVSASLGVVADANASFNRGSAPLPFLKRRWTTGAILWAGVATIVAHRNIEATLRLEVGHEIMERAASITNLSVLKTPYLSGTFRYDTIVDPDDGRFAVNLCEGMTRLRTMRALVDLSRGHFQGRPGCRHWRSSRLEVETTRDVALELDGEVVKAARVSFEILPERMQQCG
jgi:diacylglycerol kinase family enzyme